MLLLSCVHWIYQHIYQVTEVSGSINGWKHINPYSQQVCSIDNCVNEKIDVGRSYESACTISNCVFVRTQSFGDHGGIIYVMDDLVSIEETVFYNCSVSSAPGMFGETYFNGGAIISGYNPISLNKVCGFGCSAKGNGNFFFVYNCDSLSLEMVSTAKCSDSFIGKTAVYISQIASVQAFHSNNFSYNKAQSNVIDLHNTHTSDLKYCTFYNNHPQNYGSLSIRGGTITISSSNIIENSSPSGEGVIYMEMQGNRCFYHCLFKDNQDVLFKLVLGSLVVSHCYISHSGSTFAGTAASTSNNTESLIGTYEISFYNTHVCDHLAMEAPIETPVETAIETVKETPFHTPAFSPIETVIETPIYTPVRSPNESPIETVIETPIYTPDVSPVETPMMTLIETVKETPFDTPAFSPIETVIETPIYTPDVSPVETPQSSLTLNPTISKSPDQTPDESLNQNNALMVIIGSMAIIGVLFGIVFLFSFYKFGSSRFSGDSYSNENNKEENSVI